MDNCDCFKGTPGDANHKPAGTFVTLHGLPVYQTKVAKAPHSKGSILHLPDGFGIATHNVVLADEYAANGFDTTIVDYFEGDALPDIFMQYMPGTDIDDYDNFTSEQKDIIRKIDMDAWRTRHNPQHISSLIHAFFTQFRASIPATSSLHVLGHCFGGKYAFQLAKSDLITSAVIMHPSFLDQDDLTNLVRPVFVGCAETDVFTPTLIQDMLTALPGAGVQYKFSVYGGTKHGFASRADGKDQAGIRVLKESFEDGMRWMGEWEWKGPT